MATFNGELYLSAQMESVLAQLAVDDELIIADDCSTDGTLALIGAWSDARIRLLPGEQRLGVIANFERALAVAQGEIVFLCDQDDVWLPNKCKVLVEALRTADLVVSDCCVTDAELKIRAKSFFALRMSGPGVLSNLWRNTYLGCCIAFRRELLKHALPFPSNLPMHDWWLGLIAEMFGRVVFVDQPLVMYRRHGFNASPTGERSTASIWRKLSWRVWLVWGMLLRRFGLG